MVNSVFFFSRTPVSGIPKWSWEGILAMVLSVIEGKCTFAFAAFLLLWNPHLSLPWKWTRQWDWSWFGWYVYHHARLCSVLKLVTLIWCSLCFKQDFCKPIDTSRLELEWQPFIFSYKDTFRRMTDLAWILESAQIPHGGWCSDVLPTSFASNGFGAVRHLQAKLNGRAGYHLCFGKSSSETSGVMFFSACPPCFNH